MLVNIINIINIDKYLNKHYYLNIKWIIKN
jgi:hypothetical protein